MTDDRDLSPWAGELRRQAEECLARDKRIAEKMERIFEAKRREFEGVAWKPEDFGYAIFNRGVSND